MQRVNRIFDISGMQPSGDNQLADAVDHARPRLYPLPVKSSARAAHLPSRRGIQQHTRYNTGAEPVSFTKKVSIFGDVNLVHAFAFVSLVGLDQSFRDGVPVDGLFR